MTTAKKRPTIKDVAARAGVSYQTVSRVINEQAGVTPETRLRVEEAIAGLGYRPNLAARSLPRRRSNIIGLIIPYNADYLFRDQHLLAQISGIDAEANAQGYNVLLSTAGQNGSGVEAYERFVRNQAADGALVIETASQQAGTKLLAGQNYPWVMLGYSASNQKHTYSVHADDFAGAADITRHLLASGHTRIGIINGPSTGAVAAMAQRLAGHTRALAEAGLSFDPALMVYGDYTRPSGQAATTHLLSLANPPTAIFAFNDRMAMGAVWALSASGLRVPEDVAVAGFDDIPTAADFTPTLTTVRQPGKQIGQIAAQMLLKLISGEPLDNAEVILPAKVIIRQSA